jgi:hypothetical protein
MKKHHRTKLRVERETLRALHAHELRRVDGGGPIPISVFDRCPPPPITGDSRFECCA